MGGPKTHMGSDVIEAIRISMAARLMAVGLARTTADAIIERVVLDLRQACGGDRHYVAAQSVAERNAEIRREWRKGRRIAELSKHYRLSERRIYQIVDPRPRASGMAKDGWEL